MARRFHLYWDTSAVRAWILHTGAFRASPVPTVDSGCCAITTAVIRTVYIRIFTDRSVLAIWRFQGGPRPKATLCYCPKKHKAEKGLRAKATTTGWIFPKMDHRVDDGGVTILRLSHLMRASVNTGALSMCCRSVMHRGRTGGSSENPRAFCNRGECDVAAVSHRAIFFWLRVAPRKQKRKVFKTLMDEDDGNHRQRPNPDTVVGEDLILTKPF